MLLKRSFIFYSIFAIILLKIDFREIHIQRIGFLWWSSEIVAEGHDILTAIVYYDYLSRAKPGDVSAWLGLINAYLAANELWQAQATTTVALRITPKNSANYSSLVSMNDQLNNIVPAK